MTEQMGTLLLTRSDLAAVLSMQEYIQGIGQFINFFR
jgi:hypothetical protein